MASHHRTRIYTDGSFSQKSKLGGWAFVVYQDEQLHHEESGALPDGQTMQASELWAMGMALKWACEHPELWPGGVKLITDSRYIFKGITSWASNWNRRGWRKSDGEPISHPKIWERLYERSRQIEPKPAFKHVQSHREQGNKFSLDIEGNNRADELRGRPERPLKLRSQLQLLLEARSHDPPSSNPPLTAEQLRADCHWLSEVAKCCTVTDLTSNY